MPTIDELEGFGLAEAVALARGWRRGFGGYWTLPPNPDAPIPGREMCLCDYRPDKDIGQAWDLVEELYSSGYNLAINRVHMRDDLYVVSVNINEAGTITSYHWQSTPALSVATAICRAFLKVRGLEKK